MSNKSNNINPEHKEEKKKEEEEEYDNGKYTGNFNDDIRDGIGTYTWNSSKNEYYKGEFKNDRMEGTTKDKT